eukprot:TRINITY_DN26004_c0_g1_i1.p1 TRINITY_DN26004_c0_g1~~TRINITY_DN26004_c0_g1_i1.p1  ORF type:complete len:158 (-),score=18.13 TRINITY_DN26004_c0_g1_i1:35-508(-)
MELKSVKYSTKMSPQGISVAVEDSEEHKMASAVDETSWIPSAPAALKEFGVSLSNNQVVYTRDSSVLVISGQPSGTIFAGQFLSVEIIGTSNAVEQDFNCAEIEIKEKTFASLKGLSLYEWENSVQIIIHPFILPINEKPFHAVSYTHLTLPTICSV